MLEIEREGIYILGKFLSPKIKISVLVMINENGQTGASANSVVKQELDSDDDDVTLGMMKIKAEKMKLEIQRHLKKQAQVIGGTDNGEAPKKEKKKVKREREMEKERESTLSRPKRETAVNSGRGGKGVVTDWSLLLETDKGLLTNQLLSRWWYVYKWPNMHDIIDPPPQYLALEGFPGVYICAEGDKIGHIMDNRRQGNCPNFALFAKMKAKDLIEKLEFAYQNQLKELQEHWGGGSKEEIRIRKERKWLKHVRFSFMTNLSIAYATLCFSAHNNYSLFPSIT